MALVGADGRRCRRRGLLIMDSELVCCVRLQLLLYFSFWYDLLFALIHVVVGWYKWRLITGPLVIATFFLNLVLCFVFEPFRLYLGYAGNLFERVPELFLFNFFCLVPCLGLLGANLALSAVLPDLQPAKCSLVADKPCVLPIEKACWALQAVMMLTELVFGLRALKRLIREQSARFFRSLEAANTMDSTLSGEPEDETSALWATAPASRAALMAERPVEPARSSVGEVADGGVAARIYGRQAYSPVRQHPSSRLHED